MQCQKIKCLKCVTIFLVTAGLMSMSVQRPVTHPVIKSCEDGTLRIVIKSSTPSKGSTDCDGSGTVAQNFRPKITAEF